MKHLLKIGLVLILFLLPALGVVGCSRPAQGPGIDKLAPDFELPTLDGQVVSLRDFRGRPVLLNFWASWCGPCRFEMPFLENVYQMRSGEGLVVLAVNLQESPERVREFVESMGISFTVLLASSPEVPLAYNIRSIPTTFFIDKNGIIRDIKIGAFPNEMELARRLSKIMP
jgi:thiol-disulfide isomerase/thioredoxin